MTIPYNSSSKKRQLPYSKQLRGQVNDSVRFSFPGTLFVMIGDAAWHLAKECDNPNIARAFVCLPPDESPLIYDWTITCGWGVVIKGDAPVELSELIATLCLLEGAIVAITWHEDPIIPFTWYYPQRMATSE